MGQSVGGILEVCLMDLPLAKGLFHDEIMQSGDLNPKYFSNFIEREKQFKLLIEKQNWAKQDKRLLR